MNSLDTNMDEQQQPLAAMLESVNIAESLDEQQLRKIGTDAFKGYELDHDSRKDWERNIDDWTKLSKQTLEPKTYPWPRASNIKYPLLSTAAMQFAARAYPSLVPSNGKLVNAKPIGKDPDGAKAKWQKLYPHTCLTNSLKKWTVGKKKWINCLLCCQL